MNSSTDFSRRYALIVFAMMLVFLGGAEYVTRAYVIPIPNRIASVVHTMYTADSPDAVIGDSHIYRDFMREKEFANLSKGGFSIPQMKQVAELYYRDIKPGRIIFEASPQLLGESRLDKVPEDRMFTLSKRSPVLLYIFDPVIGGGMKRLDKLRSFAKLKRERNEGETQRNAEGGWATVPPETRKEAAAERIEHQRPVWNEATEMHLRQYKEMIESLKGRGADICLLHTPVDAMYLDLLEADPSFTKANATFKSIAEEVGVRYVDFRGLDMEFELDHFLNQDHLTPRASERFSEIAKRACFGEAH